MALEMGGQKLIGLIVVIARPVRIALQQPLVHLTPRVLVVAIVVITAFGPADLEEVRIPEQGVGGGIAAARMPPDADPSEIDPAVTCAELLERRDLVGQSVVAHIAVPESLEAG